MKESKDYFKQVLNTAKKTNTHEEKTVNYFFNKNDNWINPYSNNIFSSPKVYVTPDQENELNLNGYRSDNFLKIHNGKHILFSGCSNTYGFGLNQEEMWSKILYDKINKNIKCSGYFNLSIPGAGIQLIVSNLFRYFKEFGNPDYVFLNLPEHTRFMAYVEESKFYTKLSFEKGDTELKKFLGIINYQYYLMLEQYCKTNNIKLYSTSWVVGNFEESNFEDFFSSFETFYFIDPKKMFEGVTNNEKNYNLDYYYYARDQQHKGAGYNIWMANFVYDIYKKNNEEEL